MTSAIAAGVLRVLVLAPAGRDAELIAEALRVSGAATEIVETAEALAAEIAAGAGALLVAEEALTAGGAGRLNEALAQEPAWSDLPILLLTSGERAQAAGRLSSRRADRSPPILVERPVRVPTLRSLVSAALATRARQYQLRDRLEELERAQKRLIASERELQGLNAQLEERVGARTEELVATNTQLARTNADLQRFAYVCAHDLREPLRMVTAYTQLLAHRYQGRLDADADEFIRFAVEGALRMDSLVRDLLAYARLGAAGEGVADVDAREIVDEALANLALSIRESDASLRVDPLPRVVGPRVELVALFQNLIGNALKFRGEQRPEVHVSGERDAGSDWATFRVRDNGIGMDARYADRIFGVFQRLHTRSEYPGNGIGLAICKKVVESLGGEISVASEPGRGSTFTFTLPAAPSAVGESRPA